MGIINWIISNNKLIKKHDRRLANLEHPYKAEVGDSVLFQHPNNEDEIKGVVIHRSNSFDSHENKAWRNNSYTVLCGKREYYVNDAAIIKKDNK